MARLQGYGLRFDSQLAVPGALPDAGDAPADVAIWCDSPRDAVAAPVYKRSDTGLIFTCPAVAAYAISPDAIRVTPEHDATADAVSAMLIATAIPALLWVRGGFVLHAAAAILPGTDAAIAIAGRSGSGKSTLLAQLAGAGATVLADDTLVIDPEQGCGAGLPGGWFTGPPDGARRFVSAARSTPMARVAALFVLGDRVDAEAEIAPVTGVAAVAMLLAQRHRPRIPTFVGQAGAALRNATLLARAFPIYSWRRRADMPDLTATEWAVLHRAAKGVEVG